MRAVLCKEFGPPESLVVEEVPDPQPGHGQVLVDVAAAGVNFPDVLIIQNQYQFKPPLPFTPGGEIAGTVAKLGEGVSTLTVGDRILASTGVGGFAERVVIKAESAVPIPDEMDFVTASAFLFTYGTSHYALKDRGHLQPGETLLVLGAAGGVGLAAVELGVAMGARVIAAASTDDKLDVCRQHGAHEVINYSTEDLKQRVKDLTGGLGADVVYDPVGGDYAEAALRATAWEGRFLVIGFTAGIPRPPLNLVLLKGCDIVGVFWGAFVMRDPQRHLANVAELMEWFKAGKLKPHVSGTYPLAKVADALNEVGNRKVKGKVVITPA
jgi:NADPH2:quinone reductase